MINIGLEPYFFNKKWKCLMKAVPCLNVSKNGKENMKTNSKSVAFLCCGIPKPHYAYTWIDLLCLSMASVAQYWNFKK